MTSKAFVKGLSMSKQQDVSEAELAILEVLWSRQQATVREICREVYEDDSFSKYQSVQKLLERLEKKCCVKRRRTKPAHTFMASVDRDRIIARRLEQVANSLCSGSLTPLLMHLAGRAKLKPNEREDLEKLIRERKRTQ